MPDDSLAARIAAQFSYRGDRADVWRGFDRLLDTDEFLNLGYSRWYQTHLLGSPQRRLAATVGAGVAARVRSGGGRLAPRLLDVACGRGGPTVHLADAFGFDAAGVDLVPYNAAAARANATDRGVDVDVAVGDAVRLPFRDDAFDAATSLDALAYVPDEVAALAEVARVLRPGGVLGVSDLVIEDGAGDVARRAVDGFAHAWDMAPLPTAGAYLDAVAGAGLTVDAVRDVTANSVGRFGRWADLYLALADRAGGLLARLLARWDVDEAAVTARVRAARRALPHLRHVIVYARR